MHKWKKSREREREPLSERIKKRGRRWRKTRARAKAADIGEDNTYRGVAGQLLPHAQFEVFD